MKKNFTMINKEEDLFGLLFIGDGATISRTPLLKIMVYGKSIPVSIYNLLVFKEIYQMVKKNGTFICCIFLEHKKTSDPSKPTMDVVMFDGD